MSSFNESSLPHTQPLDHFFLPPFAESHAPFGYFVDFVICLCVCVFVVLVCLSRATFPIAPLYALPLVVRPSMVYLCETLVFFSRHVIVVARIRSIQCTQMESTFYGRKTNRIAPLVIIHLQCQPTPPQRTPIRFALIINPTHSAHMLRKCQLCPNQFRADERFLTKISPLISTDARSMRRSVRLRPKNHPKHQCHRHHQSDYHFVWLLLKFM